MKASDTFKTIIENYLSEKALSDTAFASSFAKESKNFEDCINYIGNEVKKMGICAFADEEIFAIAVKYYNDDTISMPAKINFKAVVNQPVKADLFTTAPIVTPQIILKETVVKQNPKPAQTTLTLFDL
jgi:hypothetical protein